jgi:hypothetical protein
MLVKSIHIPAKNDREFPCRAELSRFVLTSRISPEKGPQEVVGVDFTARTGERISSTPGSRRAYERFNSWRPGNPVFVGDEWKGETGSGTVRLLEVSEEEGRARLLLLGEWEAPSPQVGTRRSLFIFDQELGIVLRDAQWIAVAPRGTSIRVDTVLLTCPEQVTEIHDSEAVAEFLFRMADAEGRRDSAGLRTMVAELKGSARGGHWQLAAEIATTLAEHVDLRSAGVDEKQKDR